MTHMHDKAHNDIIELQLKKAEEIAVSAIRFSGRYRNLYFSMRNKGSLWKLFHHRRVEMFHRLTRCSVIAEQILTVLEEARVSRNTKLLNSWTLHYLISLAEYIDAVEYCFGTKAKTQIVGDLKLPVISRPPK